MDSVQECLIALAEGYSTDGAPGDARHSAPSSLPPSAGQADVGKMQNSQPGNNPAKIVAIKHRRDFLRAARGQKSAKLTLLLQARRREGSGPQDEIRLGLTCSRKVGGAVVRNRARRRLREAARSILPNHGKGGWDYVLVGRFKATAERPFLELTSDLKAALAGVHRPFSGRDTKNRGLC